MVFHIIKELSERIGLKKPSVPIPSVIPLPHTYLKEERIYVPFNVCWDTKVSGLQKFIHTLTAICYAVKSIEHHPRNIKFREEHK